MEFVGWRVSLANGLRVFWFLSWHNYHYNNHLLTVSYQNKSSVGKALIPYEATNINCLYRGYSTSCTSYQSSTSRTLWDLCVVISSTRNAQYPFPWKASSVVWYPGIFQWCPWKVMDRHRTRTQGMSLCCGWEVGILVTHLLQSSSGYGSGNSQILASRWCYHYSVRGCSSWYWIHKYVENSSANKGYGFLFTVCTLEILYDVSCSIRIMKNIEKVWS